jgi:hypothetical protein
MKRVTFIIFVSCGLISCKESDKASDTSRAADTIKLEWMETWFSAWQNISENVLMLPKAKPPIMFFYDETYVYTTSTISAPSGELFDGPLFFGEKLPWRRAEHRDTLTIPDGQRVPVQLMTFAAPLENGQNFFVMAAPDFWLNAGIESKEVGLEKLLTGVFLHAFAHVRQLNGIGKRITEFEIGNTFKVEVSDDIIQEYFAADTAYVNDYNKEVSLLYKAVFSETEADLKKLTLQGLSMLKKRQLRYLKTENPILVEMDNTFLTMEGTGQYLIVSWLMRPENGKIPFVTAVEAARRKRQWWAQDEGLALFLILTRLNRPDWAGEIFNENPKNIIELLEHELR